jgi:hypothetical protein
MTAIAPQLNLNGSSPDTLLAALKGALSALTKAQSALAECAPHGRDFPIQAEYPLARAQHEARQEALDVVLKETAAVYWNVHEQQQARVQRAAARR